MKTINLVSNNVCIQIDTTNLDWCKCSLIENDKTIYLGAESAKYLKNHLLLALTNKLNIVDDEIDGNPYSWVLSLAENHHTLYISINIEDKILVWQDESAKTICAIKLSKDQCQQWLSQIKLIST